MELSTHFTLEEFTRSNTATRRGIDNTPTVQVINRLKTLATFCLEPLRSLLQEKYGPDTVIEITSGYRSKELNAAVGGSPTSQHMEGEAADIQVPGLSTEELFQFILDSGLSFDQCIQEFNSWVHISYCNRNEALRATKVNGSTKYAKA